MADVRAAAEDAEFPWPIFFTQAPKENAARFFASRWPEARCVVDDLGLIYQAFGLRRGSISYFASPRSLKGIWRALRKGFFYGVPTAGTLTRAGMFLVQGEQIVWRHDIAFNGDHPDLAAIPRVAAGSST